MMLKNIIFDFGGVICDLSAHRCIDEFKKLGCSTEILPTQYSQFFGVFQKIDRGEMGEYEFYDEIRKQGNIPDATNKQIFDAWTSLLNPIPQERLEAFKQLKEHYDLYILSNANIMHWRYLDNNSMFYNGQYITPWFKKVFLSFEMHLEKPELEIYQSVLASANIKAEETLFIDDNQKNLDGASKLGIKTLLSTNGDWVPKLLSKNFIKQL